MAKQSQMEFITACTELHQLTRRDLTQGVRLAKYRKTAKSMLSCDPVSGNTLLGLIACLEHDRDGMHRYHKEAIALSDSCFSLIHYAVSLEKYCLWSESARFALLALDLDPGNLGILNAIIRLVPLTGRFALFPRLLPQWEGASGEVPHPRRGEYEKVCDILARNGLQEKDLKLLVAAISDALSQTEIIVRDFRYELVPRRRESSFIHFSFSLPDEFVATYYEDEIDAKLASCQLHPRLTDAFSYGIDNAAVSGLYDCMERDLACNPGSIRVPDPDMMRRIENLIEGVGY